MKFFRRTAEYTLFGHEGNEKKSAERLKAKPVNETIRRHISNWLRHATRMNNRKPTAMLNYRRNGRRRLGSPLKRLSDEVETGLSGPNCDG
jgi:hypothetical protein